MRNIPISVAPVGRNGVHLYKTPYSNDIINTVKDTHEAIVQPETVNGRIFVKYATGIRGWVEKRAIRLLMQININVPDNEN